MKVRRLRLLPGNRAILSAHLAAWDEAVVLPSSAGVCPVSVRPYWVGGWEVAGTSFRRWDLRRVEGLWFEPGGVALRGGGGAFPCLVDAASSCPPKPPHPLLW